MSEEMLVQETVDFKKERKFCSGMGMNFFIFFLLANGLQLAVTGLIMFLRPSMAADNFGLYLFLAMIPMYVVGVPVLWLLCKRREAVELPKHKMGAGKFFIFMMMCFGVMILGNIVGLIISGIIGLIKGSPVVNAVDEILTGSSLLVNIFIVGICAPIFEEFMFRKLLIDRMVRYGEATAIVVSGLMFGLFHGNFIQFFYAAALGMMFAFVYVKTGRLKYTIIAHMIINMSSTLIAPVLQKIDTDALNNLTGMSEMMMSGNVSEAALAEAMASLSTIIVPLIILLAYEIVVYGAAIAGIILLILRRKEFICKAGQITIPKGKRGYVVWWNLGMILFMISCLVLFVYNTLIL